MIKKINIYIFREMRWKFAQIIGEFGKHKQDIFETNGSMAARL